MAVFSHDHHVFWENIFINLHINYRVCAKFQSGKWANFGQNTALVSCIFMTLSCHDISFFINIKFNIIQQNWAQKSALRSVVSANGSEGEAMGMEITETWTFMSTLHFQNGWVCSQLTCKIVYDSQMFKYIQEGGKSVSWQF